MWCYNTKNLKGVVIITELNKNGKIEFVRFIFSLEIMFFHIFDLLLPKDFKILDHITPFSGGWFGVEFFFVVSGYLMASTALKNQSKKETAGKSTFEFMKRKLLSVLPYHLIIFTVSLIFLLVVNYEDVNSFLNMIVKVIPNFLFIQRSGLEVKDVLGVEWYISEMLFAMLILYPICKKYYDRFTRTVAPVVSVLIIGYLIKTTGTLGGSTAWSVLVSKTLLRAIAEICAGVFVFEVARNINKLNFSKKDKSLLTLLEIVSYGMIFAFIIWDFPESFSGTFFIFVCIAVCLSFSNVTYGSTIFNNRVVYFLGALSLPLYLCQSLMRVISVSLFKNGLDFWLAVILFFVSTFVYALLAFALEKKLRKAILNKIEKLTRC